MSRLIRLSKIKFDDAIFSPMLTNTPLDHMFSQEGGIFPATNYMLVGDPGSGKSTLGLDIISNINANDRKRKVLFICAEMNRIDMHDYVKRYPKFGEIDILFLGEFLDEDPQQVIEEVLEQGFDIVLTDSFIEVQEAVSYSKKISKHQSEKWLIDLMVKHNRAENIRLKYTSFLMIQQVTKGGEFAGSNKLKHNTTGMCEIRFADHFSGERYIIFSKNRRGCKYEKLYFSLEPTGKVEFDEKRLKRDAEIRELVKKEKSLIGDSDKEFEKLLSEIESTPTAKPVDIKEYFNIDQSVPF